MLPLLIFREESRAVRIRRLVVVFLVLFGVIACSTPTAGTPAPAPDSPPASAGAAADTSANGSECPLDAADLSSATALNWELRQTEADRPLETLQSVKANVCVLTTSDRPQEAGDPLVLRVDAVTGGDAARLRANFEESCTGYRGTVEKSNATEGAEICRRDGSVIEGNIAGDDRAIDVYLVNADTDTAASLTPSFEKILAVVG
jgi:hypothetical protein